MSQLPIVIVGAGVSGLYAASLLHARGERCVILESRDRLGGRALSTLRDAHGEIPAAHFDLGPAWYWPEAQPNIARLVRELCVNVFPQYAAGAMRVERFRLESPQSFLPDDGTVPDAMRFRDGVQALVAALAARVPGDAIQLSSRVVQVSRRRDGIVILTLADGRTQPARAVLLALPPRLIAKGVTFDPPLTDELLQLMRATPTWMAPHAKVLAVYPTPFWRADGYSGMASSLVGPLGEIHDASPETGPGALFGFFGIGAGARAAIGEAALRERVIAQLVRLFGPRAASPLDVYLKDWATDADTTTESDLEPAALPHGPGGAPLSATHWEGRIVFAGAETSREHPGYLEGAVLAAERAVGQI